MNIKSIQYALKIAETKNVTKAAEQLFISQPALSQALIRLESEIGVKLFQRDNNSFDLTSAGEVFVEDGRRIIELSNQIYKKMSDKQQGVYGKVSVGTAPFYERHYLSKVLPAFYKLYPRVYIEVVEEYRVPLEEMLTQKRIDVGIISLPLSIPSLNTYELFNDNILLAVPTSHPFVERNPPENIDKLSVQQITCLQADSFILHNKGRRIRSVGIDICNQAGFSPTIIYESHNCETIHSLIANGMGVGFLPSKLRKKSHADKLATFYSIDSQITERTFVLAYNNNIYETTAQRTFINFLRNFQNNYHS